MATGDKKYKLKSNEVNSNHLKDKSDSNHRAFHQSYNHLKDKSDSNHRAFHQSTHAGHTESLCGKRRGLEPSAEPSTVTAPRDTVCIPWFSSMSRSSCAISSLIWSIFSCSSFVCRSMDAISWLSSFTCQNIQVIELSPRIIMMMHKIFTATYSAALSKSTFQPNTKSISWLNPWTRKFLNGDRNEHINLGWISQVLCKREKRIEVSNWGHYMHLYYKLEAMNTIGVTWINCYKARYSPSTFRWELTIRTKCSLEGNASRRTKQNGNFTEVYTNIMRIWRTAPSQTATETQPIKSECRILYSP